MNQLEYFLASTHEGRCDIMRYMQQLRDLDEWIEYHLAHLRAITAERVAYLTAQARKKQIGCGVRRDSTGAPGGARKRRVCDLSRTLGQPSAAGAAGTSRTRSVHDVVASSQEEYGAGSENADTVAEVHIAELQRQFMWHETCVKRHCLERETLAAELAERCSEVRLSMASRLVNFASVADVPVAELPG
ncbi:hypothetical protein JKF63_03505 [Porcisia hertigi]|uniref:Uncharacterized protein n=1 Tax=Porcisia hertigi TaxID=2761500 RepID=A0A836HIA1_9TRYP|nr:hypothetical protein JKF63_03505 [Porcisia hertigi]